MADLAVPVVRGRLPGESGGNGVHDDIKCHGDANCATDLGRTRIDSLWDLYLVLIARNKKPPGWDRVAFAQSQRFLFGDADDQSRTRPGPGNR
jgi:hypothetical protein